MPRLLPAEWELAETFWVGWPSHPDIWGNDLEGARLEVANLVRALANVEPDSGQLKGDKIHLLADGADACASAHSLLDGLHIEILDMAFGDIWIRDTGPIFVVHDDELRALGMRFNGWGKRYLLPSDEIVAERLAKAAQLPFERHFWTLELGALQWDGEGVFLAQKSSLLDPVRNPGMTEALAEEKLKSLLGAKRVIWLDAILGGDAIFHRLGGAIRFLGPNHVLLMKAHSRNDPNFELFNALQRQFEKECFDISLLPSLGRVEDMDGDVMAASYLHYVQGSERIIMPLYGTDYDGEALKTMAQICPQHEIIGLRSDHLLSGGGSFHHICLPQPKWPF